MVHLEKPSTSANVLHNQVIRRGLLRQQDYTFLDEKQMLFFYLEGNTSSHIIEFLERRINHRKKNDHRDKWYISFILFFHVIL